jgi:hypothetical protein
MLFITPIAKHTQDVTKWIITVYFYILREPQANGAHIPHTHIPAQLQHFWHGWCVIAWMW